MQYHAIENAIGSVVSLPDDFMPIFKESYFYEPHWTVYATYYEPTQNG